MQTRIFHAAGRAMLVAAMVAAGCPLARAEPRAPSSAADPDRRRLEEFGVAPTAGGAVAYLRELHPTPQRQQQIAELIDHLAATSFARREAAMQQLLRMPKLPLAQLQAAVEANDPEVRWRARKILEQSQGRSAQVILSALRVIAADADEDALPEATVPTILAAVPLCQGRHLQSAARDALRKAANLQDVPALRRTLAQGEPSQRAAAAAALCAATKAGDRASLYPLLRDRDDAVALELARSLADVGDRHALPALVRLLDSEDRRVRTEAVITLRGLTGQYMGFAAYEPAEQRYAAAKKWSTWVANEADDAQLTFPVPRRHSARGDLGGDTLVSTGSKGKVRLFDPSGKEIWSHPIRAWSAEKLQNGNILIASYSSNKVIEVNPENDKVVWEYDGVNAMTAKPLAGGNFLISDFSGKRVLEVNRSKEVVWEQSTGQECFDSDRLPNGHTMFGCPNYVREVTPEGELVREWKIDGRLNGFQALPSGNILVANFGQGEVVELTPEGERVWEFKEPSPCDVFRLPSGNTLISTQKRIIEISPDDEIVREICPAHYGSARM